MEILQIFNNTEFGSIRTAAIDGKPFFVGKDVAEVLGYKNVNDALTRHVDEEDKGVVKHDTLGGVQKLIAINESGLYSLILSSKLPKAKAFKRWVTSEVLPAIRKHGVYALDQMLNDPDALITALQAYKDERAQRLAAEEQRDALTIEVKENKQLINSLQPKADYCQIVLDSPDLVPITLIAKDYGWSGKKMNQYLHEKEIQYRHGDTWLLYADYAGFGYTQSKTSTFNFGDGVSHAKMRTYWTQKGRMFIYELLKADGILPVMERECRE